MTHPGPQILFITATRIGDVVLGSGLVRRLVETQPGARITIAGGRLPLRLFADTPGLERLLPMVKTRRGGHWIELWRQTRSTRWDQVVDLRGSAIAHLLRARQRRILDRRGRDLHRVQAYGQVLGLTETPPAPSFFVSPQTEAAARGWTAGEGPILAMAPAANWIGKTWPADRFAALAADLLEAGGPLAGGRLLLLGGAEDAATADQVAAALPVDRLIRAMGEPDLLTTYAMLRAARLFIGNDSGMMHLAAAAGAPTLGLFGPTDDRLYAPWGPHAAVVRETPFATFKAGDPDLNLPEPHMDSLGLERVREAALQLLEQTQGSPT
ncbi:MAG: glycosyltransferase family 9 protein [Caulobacteraceae bacterium]|nr:glycosyltransferase family 9 protein [Caulobacteraceae bacterium]